MSEKELLNVKDLVVDVEEKEIYTGSTLRFVREKPTY